MDRITAIIHAVASIAFPTQETLRHHWIADMLDAVETGLPSGTIRDRDMALLGELKGLLRDSECFSC